MASLRREPAMALVDSSITAADMLLSSVDSMVNHKDEPEQFEYWKRIATNEYHKVQAIRNELARRLSSIKRKGA